MATIAMEQVFQIVLMVTITTERSFEVALMVVIAAEHSFFSFSSPHDSGETFFLLSFRQKMKITTTMNVVPKKNRIDDFSLIFTA